jgi:hypothetical protein
VLDVLRQLVEHYSVCGGNLIMSRFCEENG